MIFLPCRPPQMKTYLNTKNYFCLKLFEMLHVKCLNMKCQFKVSYCANCTL